MEATGYFFVGGSPKLEARPFSIDERALASGDAVVAVAGCGLCHTDLGFLKGDVKTKAPPPLVLGHEISGKVVAAGDGAREWLGRSVIVPAVLPCGDCALCRAGRENICQSQKMPGNDFGGGFATHLTVPTKFLCPLPSDLRGHSLASLSVIADAVTTPYQAVVRSGLKASELAIVVGAGGIGTYLVQHAKVAGAKVVAIDIDERRLEAARAMGADFALSAKGLQEKEIRERVRAFAKEAGLPSHGWRVFETSGTAPGQASAFSLLTFAGTLGIVGFTMERIPLRLSNVMAFDADVFGNWGCRPALYPAVVRDVLEGRVRIRENVQEMPLASINEAVAMALEHKLEKRAVLVP